MIRWEHSHFKYGHWCGLTSRKFWKVVHFWLIRLFTKLALNRRKQSTTSSLENLIIPIISTHFIFLIFFCCLLKMCTILWGYLRSLVRTSFEYTFQWDFFGLLSREHNISLNKVQWEYGVHYSHFLIFVMYRQQKPRRGQYKNLANFQS